MTIQQIGNGGGLSPSTNSSFLINGNLLVDCGRNIYDKLHELNIISFKDDKTITDVFITHTHDDHIGSLSALIYFNYFIKNKITNVYAHKFVIDEIVNLMGDKHIRPEWDGPYDQNRLDTVDLDSKYRKYMMRFIELDSVTTTDLYVHNEPLCKVIDIKSKNVNNINLCTIPGKHGPYLNYGIIIKENNKICMITGDTVATSNLKVILNGLATEVKLDMLDKVIVYHDYSKADFKDNIHACDSNINEEYGDLITEKYNKTNDLILKWYHDDTPIDSSIVTIF